MLNFYFDSGTSNCRGYLIRDGCVLGSAKQNIGSKDVSVSGNPAILVSAMKEIYDDVLKKNGVKDEAVSHIYASGMVTSPFGLCEVPHALLPLTIQRLAKELYHFREDMLFHREFLLIRGARTVESILDLEHAACVNNTRGEEIEVLGMLERIPSPWREKGSLVLLPGSHTHAIRIKGEEITDILSCFSGEMFYALSTATILSGEVRGDEVQADPTSIELGCRLLLEYGMARAVYIVHATKLFELGGNAVRRDMLSGIVYGTVAQSLALHLRKRWKEEKRLVLYGNRDVIEGYLRALSVFTPHIEIYPICNNEETTACSVLGVLKVMKEAQRGVCI